MLISDWSSDVCSSDLLSRQISRRDRRGGRGRPDRRRPVPARPVGQISRYARRARLRRLGECHRRDRKSVVLGKSVAVSVDLGGRRTIKTKTYNTMTLRISTVAAHSYTQKGAGK